MAPRNKTKHTLAEKRAISLGMRKAHQSGLYDHLRVGERSCDNCGNTHKAYAGRRFCSPRCASIATSAQRAEKMRTMTALEWRVRRVFRRHISKHRGSCTYAEMLKFLGCSIGEAISRIESLWLPGMTWENYGLWQIDHIKARASFDLADDTQAAICFHHTNLQPLWRGDNQRKENERRQAQAGI